MGRLRVARFQSHLSSVADLMRTLLASVTVMKTALFTKKQIPREKIDAHIASASQLPSRSRPALRHAATCRNEFSGSRGKEAKQKIYRRSLSALNALNAQLGKKERIQRRH